MVKFGSFASDGYPPPITRRQLRPVARRIRMHGIQKA
jgi:hypothetical protein